MKRNLPVTQNEYVLRDGVLIVTRTDPKGIINYANSDFIETSGFAEEELLGKSHNIVRHRSRNAALGMSGWRTRFCGLPMHSSRE